MKNTTKYVGMDITLVVEIENFERFRSPAQLMSYLGLVPREQSSGITTKRGRLTKTGNSRVRRALIEAAWSYRHRPVNTKTSLSLRSVENSWDLFGR
ncbi:hypothetical protein J41TS12_38520 [Paenibacillus antibioticophila]|uniref:Transposase IS116/IS110/IS902 C-terminal domain-containing protein n=1 Tax=Paenibacillus antibioticophila TaxID=1274374 RepID=A0A919XTI3_9BACL|nr:transposase [Paenibacillus antibioticophila]GIO38991.1 hypothetical protein J41TS12_38520 [Paenibacillus antibioticophila]